MIRWLILIALIATSGCSSITSAPNNPAQLKLLSPKQGPDHVLLKQKVTLEVRGQQKHFLVLARFNHEHTRLVALLPTGQQLMYVDYDGIALTQKALPSVELPVEGILGLIQFIHWPEAELLRVYPRESGWAVSLDVNRRSLWHNGMQLLDVTEHNEQTTVDNYLEGYRVVIQTVGQ